jgi:hypothetical protein
LARRLFSPPFRGDPSFLLELVQRRIKRAITHLKDVAGDLFQPLADGPSVEGFEGQDFQDEQVEGALHEIGGSAHRLISVSEWKNTPPSLGKQEDARSCRRLLSGCDQTAIN